MENSNEKNIYNKDDESEKLINLIKMILESNKEKTKTNIEIPNSISDIPQNILSQIKEINQMWQKQLISSDVAVELIITLFESNGIKKRYEKYVNDVYMQKMTKLYELLEILYMDLINALNVGRITQEQFIERYSRLKVLETNSMSEIAATDEILHKNSR